MDRCVDEPIERKYVALHTQQSVIGLLTASPYTDRLFGEPPSGRRHVCA